MKTADSDIKKKEISEVKEKTDVRRPPLYKVFLLNDDYTSMDFVVYILEKIFHKNPVEAVQVMLYVHRKGMGLAGVYTREIAETKVDETHKLALSNEYPLKCIMEQE